MAKNNRRIPLGTLLIRISAVLFCLVMITTYLTAGLYARYTAQAEGGDSARVAKFNVRALGEIVLTSPGEGEPMKWVLDSNGDGTYKITVTNDSEVAVRYDIIVELEKSAAYMSFKLDEALLDDEKENLTEVEEDKRWEYTQAGTLAPGGTSAEHTLTFVMDWEAFTAAQNLTETQAADGSGGIQAYRTVDLPFKVKVLAQQVD